MSRQPDPCGFYSEPALSPLIYSTGLPVMRGDVELLFHARPCAYWSTAARRRVEIPAFDPALCSDLQLGAIGANGAPNVTDLASIPGFARVLFPPNGRYLRAALKHDQGYATRGYGGLTDRAGVDAELLADMKAIGCSLLERQAIYRSVRLGGARGWGT